MSVPCETIKIDDVEYQRVGGSGNKLRLAIVDNRGLTFVGRFSLDGDDEFVVIHGARCVIRWGTSGHLAEIAAGPNSSTKLGVKETVRVPRRNLVAIYDCHEDGWDE